MSESSEELKPCPFCGRQKTARIRIRQPFAPDKIVVDCTNCGAQGPISADSTEAWNRRADPRIAIADQLPPIEQDLVVWYADGSYDFARWYGHDMGGAMEGATHWMLLPAGQAALASRVDPWIPVSERLPERDQRVLAWSPGQDERLITYGSHPAGFPAGVTHWQSLPAAPKGGDA